MKLASKIFEKLSKFFYHGFNSEKKIEDAYNYLKKSNQLKTIEKIRIEIEKKELKNKSELSYPFNNNDLPKTLNQILHLKLIVLSQFSSQLAISLHEDKTFYYPLPKEWLDIVSNNGIKTNFTLSRVLFFLSSIVFFVSDILKIILIAISKNINLDKNNRTIVYVPDIPNISFQENYLDPKYNFLFWLKDFLDIKNKVTFIHNNIKIIDKNLQDIEIKYAKFFLLNNLNLYERFLFILYIFKALILSLNYIIKGNFNFFYSLKDLYLAYCVKKFSSKSPNFVIFHSGNCLIRPWWTFLVEEKNYKKVYTAFYSVNHFPHYSYDKKYSGIRLMTWNNYIFWTIEQKHWLEKINNYDKEYSIVGYFPFFGRNLDFDKNKRILSIFPVTPYDKKYLHKDMPEQPYYWSAKNCIKFLEDIILCVEDLDFEIYIKLKRYNPNADIRYMDLIKKLENHKNIKIINSDISPISLIDKSDLIISPPFSSTSFIAKYFNKPTIYYDSTNNLPVVEPTMKKIRIIKKFDELKYFIKKNYFK